MEYIQEKLYQVFLNDNGDILFMLSEKKSEANETVILLYDGGEHAILERNEKQRVILDFLNEEIREKLAQAEKVLIAEFKDDGETFVREYEAEVKIVSKVLLPASVILSEEEAIRYFEKILEEKSSGMRQFNASHTKSCHSIKKNKMKSLKIDAVELYKSLLSKIVGQNASIKTLSDAIHIHLSQRIPHSPLTIFMSGPTGVGKTETAIILAEKLTKLTCVRFELIRVNCNQFLEGHYVGQLLGSPAGYIGYDDPPMLAPLANNPRCVVLFDEIEKAHNNIIISLMNAIDTGTIQLSSPVNGLYGIDCRHSIFIFTSNLSLKSKRIGFNDENDLLLTNYEDKCKQALVDNNINPEIAGRISWFLQYEPLIQQDIITVINMEIRRCAKSFGLNINKVPDEIVQKIMQDASSKFGLRAYKQKIQKIFGKAFAEYVQTGLCAKNIRVFGSFDSLKAEPCISRKSLKKLMAG